jgi:tetratricopeptide (TPR) repeat protein
MLQPILEALSHNDSARAIELAREGLAQLPSSPDLLHLLALGLLRRGEVSGAEEALERAIVLAPERASFYVLRAEVALSRRQVSVAQADLERAISHDPNHLGAYVLQARIALGQGDLNAAEAKLRLAQRVEADHPGVLRLAGQLSLARNEPDAAISAFNRAIELRPQALELYVELAMAYQRRGLHAVAAQALRRARQVDPRSESIQRLLVRSLLDAHEHEAAREELRQALDQRPQDPGGWGLMGEIEGALGNLEAAEKATLRSLELEPGQPMRVRSLLDYWASQGDGSAARDRLDELLGRHPDSGLLWQARFGLDALEDAGAEVLARWKRARPEDLDADEAEAQRAEALGETARALELAERVIAKDPSRVAATLVLVRHERTSAPERAIEKLRGLLGLAISDGLKRSLRSQLGLLLDSAGKPEAALEVWCGGEESSRPAQGGPLPAFLAAGPELDPDAGRGEGARLIWALPATPALSVFSALGHVAPVPIDRFGPEARSDGLGPLRPKGGHHGAQGAEAAWYAQLQARGLDPAHVVDALPHFDAAVRSALPLARLLVIASDPRDLLLSWLAFGSLQGYAAGSPELAARWLAEACRTLAGELAGTGAALLRVEDLREDAPSALRSAVAFLGLEGEPGAYAGASGANMDALELPSGRWRAYRELLSQPFAELTPLALELGYPAD